MISIIIPSYNSSQFVSMAIKSALAQSYRDFEIIVVDDGSTDNTQTVLGQFTGQIRYLWQENQGLAGARNTGIRAAQGEFVGLLDADDEWQPDYLATMMALAQRHPTAAVYYCQAQCMDIHGQDLPQRVGGPVIAPDTMYLTLLRANFLIPSTIMARRATVMAANLFDQTLRSCEDWDLWLRIAPQQSFVGTDNCLVRYRIHGSSLSANLTGMHQAAQSVIEKNFGLDDRQPQTWSAEKQRAYGALYRYFTLTSIQRQQNWRAATQHLQSALRVDPTLALDLELFYDLALGAQPPGYRGSHQHAPLAENASRIRQMLTELLAASNDLVTPKLRRQTWGTANFALGLAAYNLGQVASSRSFLWNALRQRPELWLDRRVSANLIKALVGRDNLLWLKQLRGQRKLAN